MGNFHLFRPFLVPLQNPAGFGLLDMLELAVAAVLVVAFAGGRIRPWLGKLAVHPRACCILLFVLPIALRVALLPVQPVPLAAGSDDFSYLLLGDTFAHGRLANATHPLHALFESVFVLQQPAYSSIFAPGQGIALALGKLIFGHPWAGVVVPVALLCSLSYWMLRAWTTPGWALTGGLFAVALFGPLSPWMNNYWGGAVSAAAGCLVFGGLPRLRAHPSKRDAILLGVGLAIQLLTRPFEFFLLLIAVAFFRPKVKALAPALLAMVPAICFLLAHNHAVTGSWMQLPYSLSRAQYGVPASFTFQLNPKPARPLTPEQQLDYKAQSILHDTSGGFWRRLADRAPRYDFFFVTPLLLALPAFLLRPRWGVLAVLVLFAVGTNFYPYFYAHYIAAAGCLFLLVSVVSLRNLKPSTARMFLVLCAAHFLFWYGFAAAVPAGDPGGRRAVALALGGVPGPKLVFVRYSPRHMFQGWIQNTADVDSQPVVWALDLGGEENQRAVRYYPRRQVWLLEPDAQPPKLTPLNLPRSR